MRKCGMSLKITTLTDMIIPNILIAQVIGRWGNFFNREVYGACVDSDTLWFLPSFIKDYMRGGTVAGQYIACPTSQYAQPLFLYEGILNLIGFILITIVLRKILKGKYSGVLTSLYLVWYGTVRVSLEGLRNEMFIMRWGNISQSILTSIVFIVVGVALLVYFYIRGYKENKTLVNLSDTSNDTTNNIEISNEESEDILVKEDTKKTPIKKSVTNKLKTDSKTKTTRKATSKSSKKTSKEEL
jgi:prolipoprotein diacylglyceryl transferase